MKDLLTRHPSKDEKPFDVYWVKTTNGGGCDTFTGIDILDALKKFYEHWADVPNDRYVYKIEEQIEE
jgi:hypothetical protein